MPPPDSARPTASSARELASVPLSVRGGRPRSPRRALMTRTSVLTISSSPIPGGGSGEISARIVAAPQLRQGGFEHNYWLLSRASSAEGGYNAGTRGNWIAAQDQLLSAQPLELRDHPLDHADAALPESGIAGVEAEGSQELGMMLGAAGRQHLEVASGEALGRALVDRIERVHQAIAEGIGVDIERRVHEVRDIGPEGLVAG